MRLSGFARALAAATAGSAFAQQLPPVPVPPENPITEEKRILGKILFWDEQLSTSNVVSCGTCHQPHVAGTDPRFGRNPGLDGVLFTDDDAIGSPGVVASNDQNDFLRNATFGLNPQVTGRAANPVIDAAYNTQELFWDGRASSEFVDPETNDPIIASGGGLESQAVGPPLNSTEMAHANYSWSAIAEKLSNVPPLGAAANLPPDVAAALAGGVDYPDLFRAAFGDARITAARIAMAIATYERTLISDQTPFDAYVNGDLEALTPQQVDGLNVFESTGFCSQCHTPPHFTDFSFRNIGLRPVAEDIGRQAVTQDSDDRGKFKVPALRNVGLKRTFMHNGQMVNLTAVMDFYDPQGEPIPSFPDNRDPVMNAISLSPADKVAVIDFLSNGLRDPRVANEQFPFDRPTLFIDRDDGARPTVIHLSGVTGSGGFVPVPIVQTPGLIGSLDFRVGLDTARGAAAAALWASEIAPVNGRITRDIYLGSAMTSPGAAGTGVATVHWPIAVRDWTNGDTLYVQWVVDDPAAPQNEALSRVGVVPLFCSALGCPPPCDPIDFNRDGLFPDNQDLIDFLSVFGGGDCPTPACRDIDFNNDGLFPDNEDIFSLFRVFGGGAC